MPPPPAATFLAFHPQDNNIIAIGMDDSTIQIYNVRVDEVYCNFIIKNLKTLLELIVGFSPQLLHLYNIYHFCCEG